VLVSLIISDVLGDPLDTIASGPTVVDSSDVHFVHQVHSVHPGNRAAAQQALEVLERFKARESGVPERVFEFLERRVKESPGSARETEPPRARVVNSIIGNNALAVAAAVDEARRRGYTPKLVAETQLEGDANEVGRELANLALRMKREPGPDCLIWGGEPTVRLAPTGERGKGGRNQQLVLAALTYLYDAQSPDQSDKPLLAGIVLLSSGTDGEDGPTDAAGAFVDQLVADAARQLPLSPGDYLRRNDAYYFFEPLDALIKTGPTHTNVCDVRVALVDRIANAGPGD
jgi:glycerate-2-kinase